MSIKKSYCKAYNKLSIALYFVIISIIPIIAALYTYNNVDTIYEIINAFGILITIGFACFLGCIYLMAYIVLCFVLYDIANIESEYLHKLLFSDIIEYSIPILSCTGFVFVLIGFIYKGAIYILCEVGLEKIINEIYMGITSIPDTLLLNNGYVSFLIVVCSIIILVFVVMIVLYKKYCVIKKE